MEPAKITKPLLVFVVGNDVIIEFNASDTASLTFLDFILDAVDNSSCILERASHILTPELIK